MKAKGFCLSVQSVRVRSLLVLLVLVCGASQSRAKEATVTNKEGQKTTKGDKENQNAKALYQSGDYEGALLAYKRMDKKYHRPRFLLRIGQCHLKLGHWRDALDSTRSFLEKEPKPPASSRKEADEVIRESSQRLAEEESRQKAAKPPKVIKADPPKETRTDVNSTRIPPVPQRQRDLFLDVRLPRPRLRLGVGSMLLGGGLVALGVGVWALWADGRPAQGCSGAPPMPGDFCGYQTQGLGAALVSVGVVGAIGGTVIIAWPGRRGSKAVRPAELETK